MRIPSVGALALVAGIALTGCGQSSSDEGGSSTSKPKVAFLTYALNSYGQAQESGLKELANVTSFSGDFDPQKQIQQCTDAVASGRFDALVLSVADPSAGTPCAAAAKSADIPLIVIDFPIGEDPMATGVTVDGTTGTIIGSAQTNGENMAELAKLACAKFSPCNLIASVSAAGDPVGGFGNGLVAKVPGVKIVATIETHYDPSVVAETLPDVLTAHPEANVVMLSDDASALAALPILKATGMSDKAIVLGNGGSKEGIAAVKAGTIFGTTGNYPFTQGKQAAQWAVELKAGKKLDPNEIDAFKLGDIRVITKDNAAKFNAEW